MTDQNLAIVVLAAGQGTRMKSATPKLLHPLGGMPIVGHVLATARELDAAHVITVVRHERDRLAEVIGADMPESVIVDQDEVPGTGRAVEQAVAALPADFAGDVLVVNGDVPLLDAETLAGCIEAHRAGAAAATILSSLPGGRHRLRPHRAHRRTGTSTASSSRRMRPTPSAAIGEINAGIYLFGARRAARPARRASPPTTPRARSTSPMSSACCAQAGFEVDALPVARVLARRGHQRPRPAQRRRGASSTPSSCAPGSSPASPCRTRRRPGST